MWYKFRKKYRRITRPQYPSYFFTQLTNDQIEDLLKQKSHEEESKSKSKSYHNNISSSERRKKKREEDTTRANGRERGATTVNGALFSIANQSLTNLSKKRWWEHFGSFLRIWMVVCGILSFTLSFAFWVNILLEYIVACVTGYKNASYLGFVALFFIIHCVTFFCKRSLHCTILLFWNTADSFRLPFVVLWRFLVFFCCLIWTVAFCVSSNIEVCFQKLMI